MVSKEATNRSRWFPGNESVRYAGGEGPGIRRKRVAWRGLVPGPFPGMKPRAKRGVPARGMQQVGQITRDGEGGSNPSP